MTGRVWTANKAKLIARYLREFVFITKHGAYIDLFAGPQADDPEGTWAAEQVMAMQPQRFKLTKYYLFERDPTKVSLLNQLRSEDSKVDITVRQGDSNFAVQQLLPRGSISDATATFCLIDQRTTECRWDTVEYIATLKTGGLKPELFYFFAQKWLNRALKSRTSAASIEGTTTWWGRDDWNVLYDMRPLERASLMAERFRSELGYEFVAPFPIYERRNSKSVMFHMIHATDHPRAHSLMRRAYEWAVAPIIDGNDETQLMLELGDSDLAE